jgi:hypothetical protein
MKLLLAPHKLEKLYNASHGHAYIVSILFIGDIKVLNPTFHFAGEKRKVYPLCSYKKKKKRKSS